MNNVNDIKQHLLSVKQTRQITNAMYLLSTARLKKALLNMDYNLKYMKNLRSTMRDILAVTKGAGLHNRFVDKNTSGTALFMAVVGDKGLCGSYNSDITMLTLEKMKKKPGALLYCYGLAGKELFRAKGREPDKVLMGSSMHPSLESARVLEKTLVDMYLTDNVNEIYIVYTRYISSGVQQPEVIRLLPLLRHDFVDVTENSQAADELLYEPSADEVLDHMAPQYCIGLIYDILMQSSASENAARMRAMQSATDNADDMIKKLQAELNSARQLTITNEITEIAASSNVQWV